MIRPHHIELAVAVMHPHVIRAALERFTSALGALAGRKPRVSVVTPTWRRPGLLESRCRPSVAAQDYGGQVEHIVVHDGPEPGYGTFLAAHRSEPNRGLSARRYGASIAAGDVIAYLDDDNAWRPGHLRAVVAALERADFAYSRALCIGPDGTSWTIGTDPPEPGQVDTSVIAHWRYALKAAGWEPSADEPADWSLVRRWMAAGLRWRFAPQVTVNYYARAADPAVPAPGRLTWVP